MDDPYLRERGQDIKYIYNRLIRIMIKGKESAIEMQGIRGKVIIVAHDLSPADTIQLNLNRISGFTRRRRQDIPHLDSSKGPRNPCCRRCRKYNKPCEE